MHLRWQKDDKSEERHELIQKLEREGLDFERWLITLATGTLVLSVTLLNNRAITAGQRPILIASWAALVLSICCGLVDRLLYIFSISSHPALAEQGDEERQEERWWRYWQWSERMSWWQILTFFAGIILLLIFATTHITP